MKPKRKTLMRHRRSAAKDDPTVHSRMTIQSVVENTPDGLNCRDKPANCMDCPEHQLWAGSDPDDRFSSDTRISCGLAGGRTIADSVSGGYFRECAATPNWCPKRHKSSMEK